MNAEAAVDVARKFVAEVVEPVAADLDRQINPEDCFSWDIVEQGSQRGLRTLTLLREYGGGGADCLTTAKVVEELARGDMGVSVVFAQTLKLIQAFQGAANQEQRARVLPKIKDDPRCVLAIGMTEPQTSSDYIIPYPPAGFVTHAKRKGQGWVINGKKRFISNGNRARFYMLFAQTNPDKGLNEGSTCFLIERGTPGFTTGHVEDKMGERLANNAELIFSDCFVPDEDVLGQVDRGFEVISQFFPASNAYAAASVLGVAVAAYERSLKWTRARVQGGQPLIQHDIVAAQLAEMHMLIDAARAYIHHAACKADQRAADWDPTLGALPKVFASEVAWKVVTKALELHGGYGYMRDGGFEKLVRDAACFIHSDGVNRTLLLKAAQFIKNGVGGGFFCTLFDRSPECPRKMTPDPIFDIHTHFIPPEFVADVRAGRALEGIAVKQHENAEWLVHPQGYRYPLSPEFFDLEAKHREMDRLGIDRAVLSLAPTLFFYWLDPADASDFCRQANDSLAKFVGGSPRLDGVAVVPLQDPEAAAVELRRAVRDLGLRGAEIGTTMEKVPLDDARFDPFFAAAAELDVPVILHPYYVGTRPNLTDFYMTNLTGNPLETCIAASRLILSGFLDRHPRLKIVLVHSGGFMPFQIGRLDHGFRVRPETNVAITAAPSTYLRRFWYDTITHAATPLKFLIDLVGADRVVFGTDLPFDMADVRFQDYFSVAKFDPATLDAVTRSNAMKLFGLEA